MKEVENKVKKESPGKTRLRGVAYQIQKLLTRKDLEHEGRTWVKNLLKWKNVQYWQIPRENQQSNVSSQCLYFLLWATFYQVILWTNTCQQCKRLWVFPCEISHLTGM